jgi:hypothetical protein
MEPSSLQSVEQDWPFLLTLLPADWEQTARETQAFQRKRGVPSAAALLRLAFAYAYCGLSLQGTVLWARQAQVAELSDVALLQRLRRAAPWLGRLVADQLAARTRLARGWPAGLRVRLVDASGVSRPGSQGTDWRLHLGFDLGTLTVDQVELTPAKGGESFKRLPGAPGTLSIGDRGYAQRQGLASLVAEGGEVLVRVNWRTLPLTHPDGTPFDLFAALRTLGAAQVGEWEVRTAPAADGTPAVRGRLVVLKKGPEAAEAARRKVQQEARRKGKTPDARSLEAAEYVILFTTMPSAQLAAGQVLALYRFRWQIELAFKRLKSLLELDELLAKEEALCRTFLLTKILAALLVEDLSHRWVDFSPWGYGPPAPPLPLAPLSCRGGDPPAGGASGAHHGPVGTSAGRPGASVAGLAPPTGQSDDARAVPG